ncbi:Uncharacterised protein [Mycobacteroides abscessus subsp. abscessus]|nr:Uncharacterised protein [Mycobacteroides abscessus subsp. abscessus]
MPQRFCRAEGRGSDVGVNIEVAQRDADADAYPIKRGMRIQCAGKLPASAPTEMIAVMVAGHDIGQQGGVVDGARHRAVATIGVGAQGRRPRDAPVRCLIADGSGETCWDSG